MDSMTHVVGFPRVCGLKCNNDMVARVTWLAMAIDAIDNPFLMDGGADICIMCSVKGLKLKTGCPIEDYFKL
jgi:hypothetical protein